MIDFHILNQQSEINYDRACDAALSRYFENKCCTFTHMEDTDL